MALVTWVALACLVRTRLHHFTTQRFASLHNNTKPLHSDCTTTQSRCIHNNTKPLHSDPSNYKTEYKREYKTRQLDCVRLDNDTKGLHPRFGEIRQQTRYTSTVPPNFP